MPIAACYTSGVTHPTYSTREQALELLRRTGADRDALYAEADAVRKACVGDAVHVRGIIEFSNSCVNDCLYCGIRSSNSAVRRYALADDEILDIVRRMPSWQQGTVVLQSGEAPSEAGDRRLGELVRRIKAETPLAVTLSVGNRSRDTYAYWAGCGMDRYLLRFETSEAALFSRLHPDCTLAERLECLAVLRDLGVQVGSGFMIGLPGETLETLADNILLCRRFELDMIGIGPFIAHPDTPLAGQANAYAGDTGLFYAALAVLRLFNAEANIPATTAFDAVFPGEGRDRALQRGANVFMPNNTPGRVRRDYLLYPDKPCVDEDTGQCACCVLGRVAAIGRHVGAGPGHSRRSEAVRAQRRS